MNEHNWQNQKDAKVYIIGSGIAGLASAVYLEKDAGIAGENIHILEKDSIAGGATDGAGDPERGYVVRGGRMHEMHYECYWELLSYIPSLEDPNVSVRDESYEFNQRFVSNGQARLLKQGKKLDVSSYGLSFEQQMDFIKLTYVSENSLGDKRIEDWFDQSFFDTTFWFIWSSMFAFQKWSSLAEMRRYMKRFMHLVDGLPRLGGVMRTKYNQYDSVVRPMKTYLEAKGIKFEMGKEVVDIDFDLSADKKTATLLHFKDNTQIVLGENDFVFFTNGSITESTDNGSWDAPAKLKGLEESGSWMLWKKIAKKDPSFGNPSPFCDNIDLQKWYSFTATMKDSTFLDYMENFSGNVDGTGGLVTMTDSNWLMSIVIARQPHFPNQPDDVKIFWGYGLYPDRKGNYINKTMAECTGAEMLEELYYHLNIQELMKPVTNARKVNCIPVAMPFVDSLFMPRNVGDRPDVIPKGATNFAFLGQFAEAPKDCVFTVEYSVRTAQMAVYGLFDTVMEVHPMYESTHNPKYLLEALKAISR
ncbi:MULTISPECIES: oleate hydratase [Shewanella]|uniref:Oleate hydratase n=2 Tax=Shewanella TaxID=22 RepID=A0A3N4D956_9GAMM|nr:oleate hydratase [Shewanella psychromarinicola]AZG33806.1 oleate hydratase [Shewanella psychromarinicola]MCL1084458.1 oleate hydratase [Shewanella psychromarinicola]RPA22403.1 oleate hydratase [Shewanella psychromarinicola]